MSASTKIIFKRSSILGKRPTSHLQPGEIALNTNSTEPGLFFDTTDGRTVKVGPTAVLPLPPLDSPERGESWFDTGKGTLNIGDAKNVWRSIAAPYLGGGGKVVFVAPEFKYASDSALNDGQTLPFQTITRAVIEVTKLKIANILTGKAPSESNKFVIMAAPSAFTVNNEPGVSLQDFNIEFNEGSDSNILLKDLIQFNAPEGGVVVPGDITLMGIDLRKCIFRPTFRPSYKHPGLPPIVAGENQPLSHMFKVAGNSFCENFSVGDKVSIRTVKDVESQGSIAIFKSVSPHGLTRNEKVNVSFAPTLDRSTGSFKEGTYYANPVDTFGFSLATGDLNNLESQGTYVQFSTLPVLKTTNQINFIVSNEMKSAHRLTGFRYASFKDLSEFYTKVQKAFPKFFGGRVVDGSSLVQENENTIVARTDNLYPDNLQANSTKNASCYIRKVILKSDYGMNFIDIDGDDVEGFRSLITNECTSVSIQKDPAAFEVYTTVTDPRTGETEQNWWTLLEATYYSMPNSERPEDIREVSEESQLRFLNQTAIENIRYHYKNLTDSEGKSYGLADISDDFRHYGIRGRDSAYIQAQSIYTIGCAIGVWSLNGAFIHLTNSTSNFGSVSFKSEGFRGINTLGGAYANAKGFQFNGIQRPLSLSLSQVTDPANKKILSLGARIISSEVDPNNSAIQILTLSSNFLPCYILPYSLNPGTAIWVSSPDCTYRGFLATDGGPTVVLGSGEQCDLNAKLRVRYSDSTIPTDSESVSNLDIPYIRRFVDPRKQEDRTYQFVISNTSTDAVAPVVGSVLRLNQTSQNLGTISLRPNVQFDPGPLGGWGRLFTVDHTRTAKLATSPNYNYVVGDPTQDNKYLVTMTVSDMASPWLAGKTDNLPQGTYCTFANKTWYAAENNLWSSVYYDVDFSNTVGPYKVAPIENCSPFVPSNVLEKLDKVSETFQGSVGADTNLDALSDSEKEKYLDGTYFRGSTIPYTEFSIQNYFDGDDGSDDLGLVLKSQKSGKSTVLVSPINPSAVVKQPNLPSTYGSSREHPTVVEFYVLSSANIVNPKQNVSVLKLEQGNKEEFLQVIGLVGTKVTAIRLNSQNSYYPDPLGGSGEDIVWNVDPASPVMVHVCEANDFPNYRAYDPDWASTKTCVLRFFEVMGYSKSTMSPFLTPRYWGERFFSIGSLNKAPDENGYALTTAQWPLEFNQPSTIIANTHTWAYCGYPFYSQGLPRYQTNEISKKLSFDFMSTATWSGRVTISGINDKGEVIFFGPQREAITSQFHKLEDPETNLATQQIFIDQPVVEFPGQVVAYTTDNISEGFDGSTSVFLLTKGGLEIPPSHVNTSSLWVQLGGVTQKPVENYSTNGNYIVFSEPPLEGTYCDIRVVTSEDAEKTLVVVQLEPVTEPSGSDSILVLTANQDISKLDINSKNTIAIVGGVDQLPMDSYTVSRTGPQTIQLTFSGVLPEGVTLDIRSICSGKYWASQEIFPVAVYPLDDISPEFYTPGQTIFELKYQGKPVNPALVNTENMLVSIGGTMQLPLQEMGGNLKGSYRVTTNLSGRSVIEFQEPPPAGATSDLRVITNSEFLPCSSSRGKTSGFYKWGPSLVLSIAQELEDLKPE